MTTDTILAKNPRYAGAQPMTVQEYDQHWTQAQTNILVDCRLNAAKVTLLEPAFGEAVAMLKRARDLIASEWGDEHYVLDDYNEALQAAAEVTKQLEGLK